MNISLLIIVLAVVAAIFYWRYVLYPKKIKDRVRVLVGMMSQWYGHIVENFNRGVNKEYLAELEIKIQQFIEGSGLKSLNLYFLPKIQEKFLNSRGVKTSYLLDIEPEFKKVIGMDSLKMDLLTYWLNVKRSFYQFYWNYSGEDFHKYMNFVEGKLKMLNLYFDLETEKKK